MTKRHMFAGLMLLCYSLICFAENEPTTLRVPPAFALAGLNNNALAAPANLGDRDEMAVFVVEVNRDGTVSRREAASGSDALRKAADTFVAGWRFSGAHLHTAKDFKKPRPWWSTLGVCYSHTAGAIFPCAPTELPPNSYTSENAPTRIFLPGGMAKDGEQDLVLVRKLSGIRPMWDGMTRATRIQGNVTVDVLVAPDGKVKQVAGIVGHPMLIPTAERALGGWRFGPVSYMGKPVEAQIRFIVYLGPNQ